METAILGGGCFWCLEAVYQLLEGVTQVESGYSGGQVDHPTYAAVCNGTTGHAEVVKITFDPDVISYRDILTVFFTLHDPTTLNQQGNDRGTQYRSVIFTQGDKQEEQAHAVAREMAHVWDAPIVTQILPLTKFYVAEPEHQNYFRQNTQQGYCAYVIAPKLAKLRATFTSRVKKMP